MQCCQYSDTWVQDLMLFQFPPDFEPFMASNASKGRGLWCAVVLAHVYKFQLIQTGEGFVTDWTREPADQNSKTTTVNVRWAALCCRQLSYSLLTPWSRILLEKLNSSQLLKKFSTFMEPKVPTTCPYPEPAQFSPCPPIPLHEDPSHYPPIYAWVFQVVSFPQVSSSNPVYTVPFPHTCYMPRSSHSQTIFSVEYRSLSSSYCSFLHSLVTLIPLRAKYSSQNPILHTPSAYVTPSVGTTKFHTHTKLWLHVRKGLSLKCPCAYCEDI